MGAKSSIQLTGLFLLTAALCLEAQPHHRIYPVFDQRLSWMEARSFCQTTYTDMVRLTTTSRDDLADIMSKNDVNTIWIGDHQDPEGAPENPGSGESEEKPKEICSAFTQKGKMFTAHCNTEYHFVCYEEENMVVINESKTWEDALKHCREMSASYDLLSLTDPSDYNSAMEQLIRSTTDEVWTGLRFLGGAWWWINGETVGEHEKLPECPSQWKHCGSFAKDVLYRSVIRDCSERLRFMCGHKKQKKQLNDE